MLYPPFLNKFLVSIHLSVCLFVCLYVSFSFFKHFHWIFFKLASDLITRRGGGWWWFFFKLVRLDINGKGFLINFLQTCWI